MSADADASGEIMVHLDASTHASVMIETRAWFGGLEFSWTEGPHPVSEESCTDLVLAVPDEAFLHPLAAEYVTDLLVTVRPMDEAGRELQETGLDVFYVIWPDGIDAAPITYDQVSLDRERPGGRGLAADEAEDPLHGEFIVRYLPPIGTQVDLPRVEPTDERTTSVTVPVDDNSDEGVQ